MSLGGFFVTYVLVFLAVLFGAWLLFAWRKQKNRSRAERRVECPQCGGEVSVEGRVLRVRCSCGTRFSLTERRRGKGGFI